MKRTIRLIGYTAAFTLVMPQIHLALNAGNVKLTYLWFAVFILVVEGISAAFAMIAKRETLKEIENTLPEKDFRDLIK